MLSKKIGMLFTFLDSALLPQLSNGLYGEGGDGMSILIKGMEMPKTCNDCLINCEHSLLYVGITDERHPDCPLIELPPHGRLIDADKFAETLKEVSIRQGYDKLFSDNILSVGDVFDAIAVDLKGEGLDKYKLAPTVIEAEGSET